MKFECSNCGQHLEAEEDQTGMEFDCPACGTSLTITSGLGLAANAAEPEGSLKTPPNVSSEHSPDPAGAVHNEVDAPSAIPIRKVSLRKVLAACWSEAFDSGFVPFVVHGVKDAIRVLSDFAKRPYNTLVHFSEAENQHENKALLGASVSLFVGLYWIAEKIVGSYSSSFQERLSDRLESGHFLNPSGDLDHDFEVTLAASQMCENFSDTMASIEVSTIALLLGMVFTTFYLFQRKVQKVPEFGDEEPLRFIRPTLLYACGYGVVMTVMMLITPIFMAFMFLGDSGLVLQAAYWILVLAAMCYMFWGYVRWLSRFFSVSKKRALITYLIVGFLFNLAFAALQYVFVHGPVLVIDKVFG